MNYWKERIRRKVTVGTVTVVLRPYGSRYIVACYQEGELEVTQIYDSRREAIAGFLYHVQIAKDYLDYCNSVTE